MYCDGNGKIKRGVIARIDMTPSEHYEQVMLFRWAEIECRCRKFPKVMIGGKEISVLEFLHAVPNGGLRSKKTAADLKLEGVKSGVPDISFPYPTGRHYGLYIEMKRKKGGKLSESQKKWLEYLNEAGYLAVVCKGEEQARDTIIKYIAEEI